MDKEIKDLLDEVIKDDILRIGNMDSGSESRKDAIDDLVKIYKLRIEETKNDNDICDRQEARIIEYDKECYNKQELLAEQVKDRYLRVGIAVAEIGLPLIFYAVWMKRGFQFEETGAYTSTTFRGLFNRFKPTKK